MFELGQETIAIVAVGASLAGLDITSYNGLRSDMQAMRAEARADREAWEAKSARLRTEARANLEAWQKERDRLHTEARADREAWEVEARALRAETGADREALGRLTGIVEEVRTARR